MVGACQQNSGIFLVRGSGLEQEICGGRGRDWDEIPAGAEAWAGTRCRRGPRLSRQRARSGQEPAETEAGTETRCRRGLRLGRQRARSGQGPDGMPAGTEAWAGAKCRRGPRLGRQGANQLKRKRSIISSSNSGFSKSFSLVIIKLLCSKNPASW